jgi:signal transduction histidine kinase
MAPQKHQNGLIDQPPVPATAALAVLLALIEVFLDWITRIEINVAIVYGLPLVVAAVGRSRKLLWGLALFLVVMTFSVYAVQIPPGVFSSREVRFVNRVLAAAALLLTAGLLHVWMMAVDTTEAQSLALRDQNEQLEAANAELHRREQEIAHQNVELDQRRREAEEASIRKTQFLASATHDIRTPLNAINLMAELIRRAAKNPGLLAEVPEMAERLQANARSLINLVAEILDISRFDSGRVEIQESTFSLDDLLAEECRRLHPLAQDKRLWLKVDPSTPAIELRMDQAKLARVLGNLVSNAIKFTETGGVTVRSTLESTRGVLIHVTDTGVGIAPEHLPKIFDEFAQVGDAGRDHQEGWGLGLAICRRLIEALDGQITVESERNRGSIFTISLPGSCVVCEPDRAREPCTCFQAARPAEEPDGAAG